MTAWTITTARSFSNMDGAGTDYANTDSLTLNAGGTVTVDQAVTGGGASYAIAINTDGTFILNPGITLRMTSNYAITMQVGGKFFVNGTSGSHSAITWTGTLTVSRINPTGGLISMDYCDISGGYNCFYASGGASYFSLRNCTLTSASVVINVGRGVPLQLINCTVASVATQYIFGATTHIAFTAINCAFTSVTDNYFANPTYSLTANLVNCTYQGVEFNSDDCPLTTSDYDIRIYARGVISTAPVTIGVAIGITHPSLTDNMFFDSTNQIFLYPYLPSTPDDPVGGTTYIYTLKKSALWRSGLAVGSRTWKYWSDVGQPQVGDNQPYTVGGYLSGYNCTPTNAPWSGQACDIAMVI